MYKEGQKKRNTFEKNPTFFFSDWKFSFLSVINEKIQEISLVHFIATMPLTTEQWGKLVDFYLVVKSVIETKWAYCNHFNLRDSPDRLTIWRIVKKDWEDCPWC